MKKFLWAFVATAWLLSALSVGVAPPTKPKPKLVERVFQTTVEITWTAQPGEEFDVLFWNEAAGPNPEFVYWPENPVARLITANTFQHSHTSPEGVFRVVRYDYVDFCDVCEPPRRWYVLTPVNIDSIRFISRVEIIP